MNFLKYFKKEHHFRGFQYFLLIYLTGDDEDTK